MPSCRRSTGGRSAPEFGNHSAATVIAARAPIRRLSPDAVGELAPALGALLLDAVADGASVGFMADLSREHATDYWRAIAAVPEGRVVLVSEDAEGVAGVVIVVPMQADFQPHRAGIAKLVVHRRARGRGLGAALMQAAEEEARALGKTLISLFTRNGGDAERLYARQGWVKAGMIPNDSLQPDGSPCDVAIYYKRIG